MEKRNIIVDCDPGQDDVMALLLALANQDKFNILGVTTVAGNQTLEKVTNNLRKLYTYLGISIPAASGAIGPITGGMVKGAAIHGISGLDGWDFPEPKFELDSNNAVTFLYDKIMNAEGKVTLVPIGPLTNLGLLFSVFPQVKEKIEMISLMGGSIYSGNRTPYAEFNIYADPEAAKIVFASGIPIVMSGLEVTHRAVIKRDEISRLKYSDGRVSKMCGHLLDFYTRDNRPNSYALHDVCSILYLLSPELFEYKDMKIEIETSDGPFRGCTITDKREWIIRDNPNARVLLDIDRDKFVKILFEGLAKLDEEYRL